MTTEYHTGNERVRLGMDFGVGTTVVAISGPGHTCSTLALAGLSRTSGSDVAVNTIPSLIQYADGKAVRYGDDVARAGTSDDQNTARWMRRYICERSPVQLPAGSGRMVRYEEAASDFLTRILTDALQQYPGAGLVFALPSNAPPEFSELLNRIARLAGAASCSWMAEEQAAAAGYEYVPAGTEPFLLISFTMAGMEASGMVPDKHAPGKMRTIGQAAGTTGCRAIDGWIVQDLLVKFRLLESDPRAVRLLPRLQYEAARLREQLPVTEKEMVSLTDTVSGRTYTARYTIADLNAVLATHSLIEALHDCIDRALSVMRMRGADTDRIQNVLLVGEGCALPAVREMVTSRFPGCTIHADHPLDAVARGAALASSPAPAKDRIARSYALRYWDPSLQEHHYRFIVHSGTRYPSAGQVARVVISAAYDGQTHLSIPLYEIGGGNGDHQLAIELVSEVAGGVRLAGPAQDADANGKVMHANERSPTLLMATPPARKGEPRFECTFTIDPERNLCLSARDLLNGTLVKLNAPVHRLT